MKEDEMKSFFTVMLMVFLAVLVAVPALNAEDKKEANKAEIPEGYKAQETCPVMGGKLTKESYADYQGQRVYFCCPGCEEPFMKDPDKYFEQAAKDKVVFENVQTTCPVMGNPIDKKFFTYYKGRGIYFCCADCVEKFKADPGKYMKNLEGGAKKGCEGHKEDGHECKHKEKQDHDHDHDHDHEN
jgi:YHS domain-containing protein